MPCGRHGLSCQSPPVFASVFCPCVAAARGTVAARVGALLASAGFFSGFVCGRGFVKDTRREWEPQLYLFHTAYKNCFTRMCDQVAPPRPRSHLQSRPPGSTTLRPRPTPPDPAPTSVRIVENGTAAWAGSISVSGASGPPGTNAVQRPRGMLRPAVAPTPVCTNTAYKADDGLKDAEIDAGTPPSSGSSMTPPGSGVVPPAPPGWSVQSVSGKSFTITRTLLAKVTATGNVPCTASASSTLSYSVSIHAQPYNFRYGRYIKDGISYPLRTEDDSHATLAISYVWDSTDGNRADLGSCQVLENVTWDSNPQGIGSFGTDAITHQKVYIVPSPPGGKDPDGNPVAYPDPTITQKPATDPGITDTFSPEAYFSGPRYNNVSWWGDQVYVFSDSSTGETATPIPGPSSGSFRITRTVAPIANSTKWGYTISTRGYHAGPYTLPGQ